MFSGFGKILSPSQSSYQGKVTEITRTVAPRRAASWQEVSWPEIADVALRTTHVSSALQVWPGVVSDVERTDGVVIIRFRVRFQGANKLFQ